MMSMHGPRQLETRPRRPLGFTVVELMVTIAIIALLISLVSVAFAKARAAAEAASSRQFMQSIKMGLEAFKDEFGYYPPLLRDDLTLADTEQELEALEYYCSLSLTSYLVGVNDLNANGRHSVVDGDHYDDGFAGPGFRDPGPDRAWGGAQDQLDRESYWDEKAQYNGGEIAGKVYDPLIEIKNEETLGPYRDRNGDIVDGAFELRDYWGNPIRYYRSWVGNAYWPGDERDLQPGYEAAWPAEWFGNVSAENREGMRTALRSAPYVLFSAGRDLKVDQDDPDAKVNRDNLMEIGG